MSYTILCPDVDNMYVYCWNTIKKKKKKKEKKKKKKKKLDSLSLTSDPHLNFQKYRNGFHEHKVTENTN